MTQIGAGAPQIRTSNMVDKWLSRWDELRVFEADGLTDDESARESRRYIVNMFPYPSGDLHMGHAEVYSIGDAIARYSRLRGFNVLHPIAWDSFGLPAENAAIKRRLSPSEWTHDNIAVQAESFRRLGVSFDWRTRFHTSDASYYRWNQWLFLKLYEHGLAYRKAAPVNWCPVDKTVLANEQVIAGACERCGATVVQRNLTQWFFRITAYAQRLLDDMEQLSGQWPEEVLKMQRNWIGRSVGAYLDFAVDGLDYTLQIFTTRAETAYGATFLAVAAKSAVAAQICAPEYEDELREYQRTLPLDTDYGEDRAKDGVFLGRRAANPVNGQRVPVYAAAYVQGDYGTGAIMGVPAHDDLCRIAS
jgi:leucyl-tRNA synthetase